MKRITFFIAISFFSKIVISQVSPYLTGANIIINPDFEEYKISSKKNSTAAFTVINWYTNPDLSTPDYWHLKDSSVLKKSMNNALGTQKPYSGNACMGFIPLSWSGFFETIVGEFKVPLKKGKKYEVSFYIKHAGDSISFKLRKLDVIIDTTRFVIDRNLSPFYESVLINSNKKIKPTISFKIKDCSDWQKASAIFKASGNERYIILGIFYNRRFKKDVFKFGRLRDTIDSDIMNPIYMDKNNFFKKKDYILYPSNFHIDINSWSLYGAYYLVDCISVKEIK